MGLNDFILTCEKDNKELREDVTYYKNMVSRLKKENEELKKQLKPDYYVKGLEETLKEYQQEMNKVTIQQEEFIKYLEDEIKEDKDNLEKLCELYKIPKENNSAYKFAYSYIKKIEEILQKYKETIGVLDENNKQ